MWLYLARVWNVDVHHAGILIVPNKSRLGIERAARAIDDFVRAEPDLRDHCFTLRIDGTWQQQPDR
jgi:hypothetical protein